MSSLPDNSSNFGSIGSLSFYSFTTDDGSGHSDTKIYSFDGSNAEMILDLGDCPSPNAISNVNGRMIFRVMRSNGANLPGQYWTVDAEYYGSDGTALGTQLLADVALSTQLGSGESSILGTISLGTLGSDFVFASDNQLADKTRRIIWASDGTRAGTHMLVDAGDGNVQLAAQASGLIYFTVQNNSGETLYATNGTQGGTQDLLNGPGGSIQFVRQTSSHLYFTRQTASGLSLYSTDGTKTGTQSLVNLPDGVIQSIWQPYFGSEQLFFQSRAPPASPSTPPVASRQGRKPC